MGVRRPTPGKGASRVSIGVPPRGLSGNGRLFQRREALQIAVSRWKPDLNALAVTFEDESRSTTNMSNGHYTVDLTDPLERI
jgi:hypothetical protein